MRCFGTLNFVLGRIQPSADSKYIEGLASAIVSPLAQKILNAFTDGAIRYRLEFVDKGAQRGAVRQVVNRAYTLCPEILNDARQAPWAVDVHPSGRGDSIELRPRFSPDPRLLFRQRDVPAASHPPLAASMARLAGPWKDEVVWDPFCGSGLELIERAFLGGVRKVIGTDLSGDAISISETNFAAAGLGAMDRQFVCADFRDFRGVPGLGPNRVSLILSNPPMGMRVPIPNLKGLIDDLFRVAGTVLQPGGRLVFANPLKMESSQRSMKLESRQVVDLGGFNARMEKYIRI
jgi:predicted RNA methylase